MIQKILVAIDQSTANRRVVQEAIALSAAIQAELNFVHVLSFEDEGSSDAPAYYRTGFFPVPNVATFERYQHRWEMHKQQGLELLQFQIQHSTEAGVRATFTQVAGDPGRAICRLALEWEADLIVMGRRGLSGLSEILIGSVSNYVLHHAPCSVLTVQTPQRGIRVAKPEADAR
ncbi:universal stress protein [Oculatella sp. LEGE 06141]|uniref:universal stress protein n=1 Tax=Oculatella sp. LEGE 06141 TaxID=1828648 RepID=UPI001880C1F0|nr:universal stress protein [Oculatella sp. LEGE 06141]MBE9181101.1 universal stress protein [Oculatella sp. LEGE 06141]